MSELPARIKIGKTAYDTELLHRNGKPWKGAHVRSLKIEVSVDDPIPLVTMVASTPSGVYVDCEEAAFRFVESWSMPRWLLKPCAAILRFFREVKAYPGREPELSRK